MHGSLNTPRAQANAVAAAFECQLGTLSFTYLGLPLSTTRPRILDFAPLINQMERRLNTTTTFLGFAGKVELTTSVLSAMPTYTMCTLKLPIGVVNNLDKAKGDCL